MLNSKDVGCVIRRFRKEKGLSQEVVSGLADIGRTHLSAIERGERRPTLETFFRLSEALGVRPSVIVAAIETERKKRAEQEENA
ncbi:MAG: helix-turn-helix transcriptional regulator [Eubacterium sp.]|nr:helix-turn-helix transcriptional regulator [Eubacterium sp.]